MDERVARLEIQVEQLTHTLDHVATSVDRMSNDLARYRGAWGMLVMVAGAVLAAFTAWTKLR